MGLDVDVEECSLPRASKQKACLVQSCSVNEVRMEESPGMMIGWCLDKANMVADKSLLSRFLLGEVESLL